MAVAAVIGGGAWAWHAWSAQGPQPAEALPASTLAYLAVDLDPSGGQKVAAYQALKKFPSLEKELGLGSKDDLRESLVDTLGSDGGCDLPWSEVKDWAGDRGALAVVPLDEPRPVVALQIADVGKAEAGLAKVARSCGDDEFGFVVGKKWAILAESEKVAQQVASEAEHATLAEDADFQELTGAAGDPGVVTVFAAPEAGRALLAAMDEDDYIDYFVFSPLGTLDPVTTLITWTTFLSSLDAQLEAESFDGEDMEMPEQTPEEKALWARMEHYEELSPAEQKKLDAEMDAFYEDRYDEENDAGYEDGYELPEATRTALEGFSGIGGTARFDDGGLELEIVADPALTGYGRLYDGKRADAAIAALPADTAIAFAGGFADGWAEEAVQGSQTFGLGMDDEKVDLLKAFKDATGLAPADLEALGGETIAVGARTGFDKIIEHGKPTDLPLAVRITGDADAIEAALAKVRTKKDLAPWVQSRRTDGGVVVGPSTSYLEDMADPEQTLGESDRYADAVPDAEDALSITFLDFDAGRWLTAMSDGDLASQDIAPLSTAGLAVSEEGDRERLQLRLSLD